METLAQVRIVGAVDAGARLVLHALYSSFRGQARPHGIGQALPPALVMVATTASDPGATVLDSR